MCRKPHICGDEPQGNAVRVYTVTVNPTYVGMNRPDLLLAGGEASKPHIRGDEPFRGFISYLTAYVNPTYVGMNRWARWLAMLLTT